MIIRPYKQPMVAEKGKHAEMGQNISIRRNMLPFQKWGKWEKCAAKSENKIYE